MNLTQTAVALALAVGFTTGAHAKTADSASVYELGTIDTPSYFHEVEYGVRGNFKNLFKFSVESPTFANGTVTDLDFSAFTIPVLNISGLTAKLFDDTGGLLYNFNKNPDSTHDTKVISYTLAPGDYSFQVAGHSDGALGGMYKLNVSMVAAPVPEPETYVMLLAGLGLIGAVARRRNRR